MPDAGTGAASRAGGGRWADLGKRTLSAVILGPLALLCTWFGGWAWAALIAVAATGLGVEWAELCGRSARRMPGLAVPGTILLAAAATLSGHGGLAVALLAGMAIVIRLAGGAALAAGTLYAGLPLVALAWLRDAGPWGRSDVLFLVAVVWAADSGAYLAGRLLGGPKLAPAISPGKTWSGAVGGVVAAVLVGGYVAILLAPVVGPGPTGSLAPYGRLAALAVLLAVVSQAGDLFESWIKRQFGVKDSGWLIPGHGGLLDRLDGLLAAALAAACIAVTAGRGGVLWN